MKNFIKTSINQIFSNISIPYIYLYLYTLSFINFVKSLFKRDVIYENKIYKGQSVLLLALFEKGVLRNDIKRLLQIAKDKGLYVVAVNTKKLQKDELTIVVDLIDVYIEQFNYGRDFGSYKKGFNYLYRSDVAKGSPKVLMLNDSVYYDSDRLGLFIDEMLDERFEVRGATENFEINYHLGSFAICFDNKIVNDKRFKKYWSGYALTDVRPAVIERGEMGLSKVLNSIVSNELKIGACYNAKRVRSFLRQRENLLLYIMFLRKSDLVDWRTRSPVDLIDSFLDLTHLSKLKKSDRVDGKNNIPTIHLQRDARDKLSIFVTELEDIHLVFNQFSNLNQNIDSYFYDFVRNELVENSRSGSQIHQNNACFLLMGMPIIKLDGIYRGMFSEQDVFAFEKILSERNFNELIDLLYSKPYGGNTLKGLKNAAFKRGLI